MTLKGCQECFIPEFKWHRCINKKSKAYFYNVAMISLSRPILLMGVRTGDMIFNAYFLKEGV
jgi:hypothetical protein